MTLDVTQGSIVAVDPDELRTLADRIQMARDGAERAVARGEQSAFLQSQLPVEHTVFWAWPGQARMRCGGFADGAAELVTGLRVAADAYEAVELRTMLAMHGEDAQTPDGALARDRLDDLLESNPAARAQADHLWAAWRAMEGRDLVEHWSGAGRAGAVAMMGLLAAIPRLRGALGMGAGSLGEPDRARMREGRVAGSSDRFVPMKEGFEIRGQAPTGLADAITRIPNAEGAWNFDDNARVRIDAYTMPDGDTRYAVSIAGSSEMPWDTSDPFNWGNNLGLYAGTPESEGYDFVLEALERAGAGPGDVVDATGFSQGAMIAQRLATDSDFEVQHVTTIGAPLRLPLGDGVTSITLAHDDDPVAALADGGSPMSLGSDESLLIRRPHEERDTGILEWDAEAHRVGSYAETARIFEESGDARAAAVRAYYERLGEATSVRSTTFYAPEDRPPRVVADPPPGKDGS
ncbi:hypothetical protein [Microbacterium karelineae]|uniref:hypothetical protein n=1 Tax=Microbacterium karelineae TaxID=2654283 RepID=UPI0012EA7265|nr:hypothetical protein [Microbacterium karelineae]